MPRLRPGAHKLVGDGVEGPTAEPSAEVRPPREGRGPGEHVVGGTSREGEEQDALGRHPPFEQARDACGEGARLAGACPGDDDER
ncbi:MAG: hypothetical protein JWO62_130 [Acidimicrobiaceae bacterium]|nr:hypothetical protein [Acidimicrobiaceae bacterium]